MKNSSLFLIGSLAAFVLTLTPAARGQVRMTEVNLSTKTVEVTNFGSATVDLSGWYFCHLFIYPNLGGDIAPGASRQFTVNFNVLASDLCLYNSPDFGSTAAMEDFIQWGSGNNGREFVAVAKQIWNQGTFLTVPADGLSFHARGVPGAGSRNGNWFVAQPHAGFPLPDIEIESVGITQGQWRIVAKSYYLADDHSVEVSTNLANPWQLLNAPSITDLGESRIEFRFAAAGTRQFARIRTD